MIYEYDTCINVSDMTLYDMSKYLFYT